MIRFAQRNIGRTQRQICAMVICLMLCGCYTYVTPPINPTRPTVVYLCDYGVHSSLLLPITGREYVEFLYGDWNWAALKHHGIFDAIGAVFFSQQSTLARRFVCQLPGEEIPRPIDGPITEIPVVVNGDGCVKAVVDLTQRWERHRDSAMASGSGLDFVKDDQPYSWTHDCNTLTTDCLREMGCKVNGFPIWSNFKVVDQTR